MNRRTLLKTGIAAGSCFIAGCSQQSDEGPVETVRAYIQAVNANDREKLEEVIHPEADYQSQQAAGMGVESIEIELHETTVIEKDNESAAVEIDTTVTALGEEQRETQQIDLQKHDGEWHIW